MLKLEAGMSNEKFHTFNSRGFTLIEILVVLLIIGIIISFAMLAFGDFGAKSRVKFSGEQFINFVKLVQQQAILETSTLGISLQGTTYQTLRLMPSQHWQAYSNSSIFHVRTFSGASAIKLNGHRLKNTTPPQIVINESGDMSAFQLTIYLKREAVVDVIGYPNGALQLLAKES